MVQKAKEPAHHNSAQPPERSLPAHQTWRVRGVPMDFDRAKLVQVLQQHPHLQPPSGETPDSKDKTSTNNGVTVYTLASDLGRHQVATVRFQHLPARLGDLDPGGQLTITIDSKTPQKTQASNALLPRLAIDQHFRGITVLSCPSPSTHAVDVLALPGLNGHPFGSFVHKGDGHMWLSDSLPHDMPNARVMIYGYDSKLKGSTSFAKGALIRMTETPGQSNGISHIVGALFFGVPNRGMDLESPIPMVTQESDRSVIESLRMISPLSMINSDFLTKQEKEFAIVLEKPALDIYCFYETSESPTAKRDPNGNWKMNGPPKALVSVSSATGCLPQSKIISHSVALSRTHSNLVKFALYDSDYDTVSQILQTMGKEKQDGLETSSGIKGSKSRSNNGNRELLQSVQDGDLGKATSLLNQGVDVDTRNGVDRSPLHLAVLEGHQKVAELLLKRQANVNATDKWGEPPLRHAVLHQPVEMARLLIRYGANVHAKDDWGETPLGLATQEQRAKDKPEMARLLRDAASSIK